MKIAICLSGQRRTYDHTIENIKENIAYNSDLFAVSDHPIIDSTRQIVLPKNAHDLPVEEIEFFGSKVPNKPAGVQYANNMVNMFYKIYRCNKLKKRHERENDLIYDVVVRARPDVTYSSKVDFADVEDNTIYLTNNLKYDWGGLCDQFFYGTSETMDKICDIYLRLSRYISRGVRLHPETLLKHHISVSKINVARCNVDIKINRFKK